MNTGDRTLGRRIRQILRHRRIAASLWVQETPHIIALSVLVFVPLLIAVVTWLSNISTAVSFLLFPPLAAGTYSLFARPEESSSRQFILGITAGALCGWIAVELMLIAGIDLFGGPIRPESAAISVLLVALLTQIVGIEEPSAYSTSLLVLVTGADELAYVAGVAASSLLVVFAFVLWRDRFYEHRAEFLYRTDRTGETVLAVLPDAEKPSLGHFAARLSSGQRGGTVVLLGTDTELSEETNTVKQLETLASTLAEQYGVTTDVIVVEPGTSERQIVTTAKELNCQTIVTQYDPSNVVSLEAFFQSDLDVIGLKTTGGRTTWRRVVVGVRSFAEFGWSLVEIAQRVGSRVIVCHSIADENDRSTAEQMLGDLIAPFDGTFETRVTTAAPAEFFSEATRGTDLIVIGASTDRTSVSRALVPPTYYNIDANCDIAVVHRGDN